MSPALDAWNVCQFDAESGGVFFGFGLACENYAGGTIGNLAAVLFAHAAFDDRVECIIVAESAFRELSALERAHKKGKGENEKEDDEDKEEVEEKK